MTFEKMHSSCGVSLRASSRHLALARWVCILTATFTAFAATARADILYVANEDNNSIVKITSGGVSTVFANSGLSTPFGLAFDAAGNLYAANASSSNNVVKFSPAGGAGSVFANGSSGLDTPTFLAFTNDAGVPLPLANQTPEPASFSLVALGGHTLLRRHGRRRA